MRTIFAYGFRDTFQGPRLGQLESLISVIPQLISTGIQAYGAKRSADQAKQMKARAEQAQKQADAAKAAADAAQAKALQDQMLQQQAIASSSAGTVMGMSPLMLAVGGLGLLGLGAVLVLAVKK